MAVAVASPAAAASSLDEAILLAGSRTGRDFLGDLPGCGLLPDLPPLLPRIALGASSAKQRWCLRSRLQASPTEL